jgi:BCCT family betaine/carnitine transporter
MTETNPKKKNFDFLVIIISLVVVLSISAFFLSDSERAIAIAGNIFTLIAYNFGTPILWYAFGLTVIGAILVFSKYGNIRMGNEKPDYSTFSYIVMMALAGCGSGTVYWAFLEWSYYFQGPAFGLEPKSTEAIEWAVTYSLHHWGLTAWAIYAITAIPMMYAFYIKKQKSLKLSDVTVSMIKNKTTGKIVGRIIDVLYPISLIFGLIIVIALGVPIVSAAVSTLFGIQDTLMLKMLMIGVVAIILISSSFLGLTKGMKRISGMGTYFIIGLILYILIFGPTRFILENTSSSVGIWLQNFLKMSLYTDAIDQGKFPQAWTAYFWAYWMIFIPLMCVFITKVSKGRTLREVVVCTLGGGTTFIVTLFAISGSFMLKTELDGKVIISQMVNEGNASQAIAQSLNQLPGSVIVLFVFIVSAILLLITTLDGSVFTLACNTQDKLDKDNNPSTALKIFWCLAIIAIPSIFIIVKAPVGSMQSAILIFALPILVLTVFMLVKTFIDMNKTYSKLSAEDIKNMHRLQEDKE